jgi:hypothetical protein
MKASLCSLALTLSLALGVALAQTTPPDPQGAPQTTPTKTQSGAKTDSPSGSAATPLPEMKTTTFKGVLVDMSCASHTSTSPAGTRAGFEVSFLDTAHYLVTKHSQTVRLTLFVAVTARVYSS